uniref:F-box protein 48 n=1 Tax=Sander lucioperca TaxID=283035 RepID=A0A8D0CVW0_SANLU
MMLQHHDSSRTSPVFLLSKKRPSLTSTGGPLAQNFAEMLPTEMSTKIFGELDAESLCSAARTCRLWHDIIEESEQVWRRQCLPVRAVCQREVDGDRRDGLSWKHRLLRNTQIPPLTETGDAGEELQEELCEERLAERALQPREVSGGAERQEDGAAGRRDLGRDPTGRAGQMTPPHTHTHTHTHTHRPTDLNSKCTSGTSECLIVNS